MLPFHYGSDSQISKKKHGSPFKVRAMNRKKCWRRRTGMHFHYSGIEKIDWLNQYTLIGWNRNGIGFALLPSFYPKNKLQWNLYQNPPPVQTGFLWLELIAVAQRLQGDRFSMMTARRPQWKRHGRNEKRFCGGLGFPQNITPGVPWWIGVRHSPNRSVTHFKFRYRLLLLFHHRSTVSKIRLLIHRYYPLHRCDRWWIGYIIKRAMESFFWGRMNFSCWLLW